MIEINLLPDDLKLRKAKKSDLSEIPIRPVAIGIAVTLVITHVMLFAVSLFLKKQALEFEKIAGGYAVQKGSLDTLNKKILENETKIKAIDDLTKSRILWARLLNGLSDAVLQNIWINSLIYESNPSKQVLYLDGSALGQSEEATALVGKFISSLKSIPDFSVNFDDIDLESIRGGITDKQEVMNFRLACIMKESLEVMAAKEKAKKEAEAKAAKKAKKAKEEEL